MKHFFTLLLFSVLLFSCSGTKTTVNTKKAMTSAEVYKPLVNSLLWKISGNNLEKPSYLYGTMHLTCNYQLKDKIKNALDNTSQLVLEVDMDDPLLQSKSMKAMMLTNGQTLDQFLTPEEYTTLSNYFKKQTGLSLDMLKTFKPFALNSMLIIKQFDCPVPVSYENEFMKMVKEDNEEVLGLETIESQFAIFDNIPYKKQLQEMLKLTTEEAISIKEELKKITEAYEQENIENMYSLMKSSKSMEKEFQAVLLDNRNEKWIPVIGKIASEKSSFFGVGAMHLAGEKGVINLLRKQGFKVEAVK